MLTKTKIQDFVKTKRWGMSEPYFRYMKRVVAQAKVMLKEQGWVNASTLSKKKNGWAAKYLKFPAKEDRVCHVKTLVLDNGGSKSYYYTKDEALHAMELIAANFVDDNPEIQEDIVNYLCSDEFGRLLKGDTEDGMVHETDT